MSIIYCDKHNRSWDSDQLDICPSCENDPAALPIKVPITKNPAGDAATRSRSDPPRPAALPEEAELRRRVEELESALNDLRTAWLTNDPKHLHRVASKTFIYTKEK